MFKINFKSKKDIVKEDIRKVEDVLKKDFRKAEDIVKKDAGIVRQDFRKLETKESFDVFITYWWAIGVIIIGIIGFIWWQYYNIEREGCDFGRDFCLFHIFY